MRLIQSLVLYLRSLMTVFLISPEINLTLQVTKRNEFQDLCQILMKNLVLKHRSPKGIIPGESRVGETSRQRKSQQKFPEIAAVTMKS